MEKKSNGVFLSCPVTWTFVVRSHIAIGGR